MQNIKLFILLIMLLSSCINKNSDKNEIKLTDYELNALDSIRTRFAGDVNYKIGSTTNNSGSLKSYLEIELSNSKAIDILKDYKENVGSGIALHYYTLLKNDSFRYDFIRMRIISENKSIERYISKTELQAVNDKLPYIEKIIKAINDEDYNWVHSNLNNEVLYKYNKEEIIKTIESRMNSYGRLKNYTVLGYNITQSSDNKSILHVIGQMFFQSKASAYSIDIDLNDEVFYFFDFSYE